MRRERGFEAEEVCVRVGLAAADAHVTLCDEALEEGLEGAPEEAPVDSRAGVCRVEPAALQAVVAGAPGPVLAAVGPLHALGQAFEAVMEPEDLEPEGFVFGLELAEPRVTEDLGEEGQPFDDVQVWLVSVPYKEEVRTQY